MVVATPAITPKGVQQWMCDAVVPDDSPLHVSSTVSRSSATSTVTVATPVAVVTTGGVSCAPDSPNVKEIGVACVAVVSNNTTPARKIDA